MIVTSQPRKLHLPFGTWERRGGRVSVSCTRSSASKRLPGQGECARRKPATCEANPRSSPDPPWTALRGCNATPYIAAPSGASPPRARPTNLGPEQAGDRSRRREPRHMPPSACEGTSFAGQRWRGRPWSLQEEGAFYRQRLRQRVQIRIGGRRHFVIRARAQDAAVLLVAFVRAAQGARREPPALTLHARLDAKLAGGAGGTGKVQAAEEDRRREQRRRNQNGRRPSSPGSDRRPPQTSGPCQVLRGSEDAPVVIPVRPARRETPAADP